MKKPQFELDMCIPIITGLLLRLVLKLIEHLLHTNYHKFLVWTRSPYSVSHSSRTFRPYT